MVAHNPKALTLAPNTRFTENTKTMPLGEGLWKEASGLRSYRRAGASLRPLWQQGRSLAARHLLKWNLLFFIAGFVFDVFATRAGADHTLLIVQQIVYLAVIGAILYVDFVRDAQPEALPMPRWIERLWQYRGLVFHFCLGTLMNLYSIFFLMSASLFSSIAFVVILFGAVVLNELHEVRRGLDVRVAS
jgi:hypothetical protein